MSRAWPTVKLGELFPDGLANGLSPSRRGEVEGRVLTLSAITRGKFDPSVAKDAMFDKAPSATQIAQPGTFLIARGNGNINLVGVGRLVDEVPDDRIIFPDTIIGGRPDENRVVPGFLERAWATRPIRRQIERAARTTNGTHKVNQQSLLAMRVPAPPLPEQRRIAAILDKADAIRRKRREAVALTEELLRSAFLEMFGDPVTNPKGWPTRPLGDALGGIQPGWSAKGENRPLAPGEFGVLKVSAVTSGRYRPSEYKAVSPADIHKPLVVPKRGDLLFSRANTRDLVAATCLVTQTDERVFLPDKLWRIEADERQVLPEFLQFTMSHPRWRREITRKATGTSGSMLNVSQKKVRETRTIVPPLAVQATFKSLFWKSIELDERLRASAEEANDLFHSLVQRAFRGDL